MATALHQELHWLLYTELLEFPYVQEGRAAHRDALLEHILAEPRMAALCDAYMTQLHRVADRPDVRATLERQLEEYGKTRDAVSELASSLLTLATGYAALSKATPAPSLPAQPPPPPSPRAIAIAGWVRPWVPGITRSFPSRPRPVWW